MGTLDESADSISAELEAAFNSTETQETAPDTTGAEVQTAQTEQTQTVAELLEAPKHWPDEVRGRFGELSKLQGGNEWQKWLLDRHKAMEGDYTKKRQADSEALRTYQEINELFSPFQELFQTNGLTPQSVIQRYIQADQYLQQNPVEALKWLAQSYGVDIGQLTGQQQQQASPEYQQLQRELAQLRQSVTAREQAEQKTRLDSTLNDIRSFAETKDEAGNPAHPYFDEVLNDMMVLARAEMQAGRQPKLQDLYDKATWANPDVRQKVLSSQREAEEKKRLDDAAKKAAQAKKASASVSGSPGASAPRTDRSLREELEASLG